MLKHFFFLLICLALFKSARATHAMGGEITWECQGGGNYVFQLVFFRDCNGAEINAVSENLKVWYHPSITDISLSFISRIDISPTCSPVPGSPLPLDCGIGNGGGNGIGAIEKITYRSAPIALPGTPGVNGWVFTYENFSRSNSLTNITNPSNYGITISAKMYAVPGAPTGCIDNSPQFLQEPYFVTCAGTPYVYNMNAIDPDLDSIAIDFGIPYDFLNGATYNPPMEPSAIPFEPGFSYSSPTPGVSLNPLNIPAAIDGTTGELTFTCFNIGNYVVKVSVKSYRNGILISEVEREMQIVVVACNASNNAPVINAPFGGGLFTTTVNAGTLVNFTLSSTDLEVLQDGSPQSNIMSASGPMFGTGYTLTSGCDIAPCATLSTAPLITGIQGSTVDFSWQTSCDHLIGASGIAQDVVPYTFVFRVQDDYCQVPKVTYATVTINVLNPGVVPATEINCIQSDASGNVTLNWSPVSDPFGTFIGYEVHSMQDGLIATIPGIGTSTYIDPAVTGEKDYFLTVLSGCGGNTVRSSDTISNIFLTLNNPSNGTAVLQWNDPIDPSLSSMGAYYYIMREYPSGTWTILDSVPYGVNFYKDTIDICSAFLNYQIILPNTPCNYTSNIEGDDFEDMMTPDIPVISAVSVDTLTGNVLINWNQNNQPDTYGYVIYTFDASGAIYELDTVWGITNTSYSHVVDASLGPLTYSVAAFDSCWTPSIPPTYQTSAKADLHTTIFNTAELDICNYQVDFSWTPYVGWTDLQEYQVWGHIIGEPWANMGSTTQNILEVDVQGLKDYCFFIMAISSSGDTSFSNITCLSIVAPLAPDYHYLQVATVENGSVRLEHLIDASSGVQGILFEKMDKDGVFQPLIQLPAVSDQITYLDTDVDIDSYSYNYRSRIVDSCGSIGSESNIGKTILLNVSKDDIQLLAHLNWNPYQQWNGAILGYNIYRGIDGVFSSSPIETVPSDQRSFTDDLNNVTFTGKVCYYVEAIEGSNLYDDPKRSISNVACEVFEPIIYVPNAFIPGGVNQCFFPVITNFDPSEYRFVIFDRWGQEIFHTTSVFDKWCGYIGDSEELAEVATYVYMITIKDGDGNEIVKRGHVTLVR